MGDFCSFPLSGLLCYQSVSNKKYCKLKITLAFSTFIGIPKNRTCQTQFAENNNKLRLVFDYCIFVKQGLENLLDTTALLRSCVQSAVGMLRDRVDSGLRSTQRVEILLTLLSDDDSINGAMIISFIDKTLF